DAFFDKDKKQLAIDWEDEIVLGIGLTRGGEIVHEALAPPAKAASAKKKPAAKKVTKSAGTRRKTAARTAAKKSAPRKRAAKGA
ncbi:MAG: NAD(P)(+) transhydrogenase (Re/Si-specific) subunit alpha, partial [Pseudomonadota bacterium]|nr:NAD(P)(+) transhydrogenase (Re/Si-specific) subunit alpha [Pseudomonadota bacterium]